MNSACPFAKDVDACTQSVRKLCPLLPNGFLDSKFITAYKSMVPQVNEATNADVQISGHGESSLAAIAQRVTRLYQLGHRDSLLASAVTLQCLEVTRCISTARSPPLVLKEGPPLTRHPSYFVQCGFRELA